MARYQPLRRRIVFGQDFRRQPRAVPQAKADRMDIVFDGPIPQGMRPGRVVRQHTPELAHVAAGRVRAEHQPVTFQLLIEFGEI